MSDLTSPPRQLLHQGVEWHWEEQHEAGFKKVKEALTLSPVMGYYDAEKELTLRGDASSTGLGAALIQQGQPIAYALKALTPTQITRLWSQSVKSPYKHHHRVCKGC